MGKVDAGTCKVPHGHEVLRQYWDVYTDLAVSVSQHGRESHWHGKVKLQGVCKYAERILGIEMTWWEGVYTSRVVQVNTSNNV